MCKKCAPQRRDQVRVANWKTESPQNETNPAENLFWKSNLQNYEETNFSCLSHIAWSILLWKPHQLIQKE